MIPFLIYLSYLLGGLVVPQPVRLASVRGLTLASIHQNFVQYFVGSWLLAGGTALLAGGATYAAAQLARPRKRLATAHG